MPNSTLPANHFLYLANSRNEDDRQEQYLALLEAAPQSLESAEAVLSALHHRQEWNRRQHKKRFIPLSFDPIAKQSRNDDGDLVTTLNLLSPADQKIIRDHVLEENSLRAIAKRESVSKDTIRKRYDLAKAKLIALTPKSE